MPRKRLVATASPPTTTVSECVSPSWEARKTLDFVGDPQQTGLKGSEGMSEDVRAFLVPLL
jgi:hypothetical protein